MRRAARSFRCVDCKRTFEARGAGGVGTRYAIVAGRGPERPKRERRVCYECCARRDIKAMLRAGTAQTLPLYLASRTVYLPPGERPQRDQTGRWSFFMHRTIGGQDCWVHSFGVGNWPGSLNLKLRRVTKGAHNVAGVRFDAWFEVPGDAYLWHGTCYGSNTHILHARRTKAVSAA